MEDEVKHKENVLLRNYGTNEEVICAENDGGILGREFGYLSFENDVTSYSGAKKTQEFMGEETPRHGSGMVPTLGGEAIM